MVVWVGSGGGWWQTLVVSQRVSPVTLRTTFRNHVNEAGGGSSAAKLFALEIFWFNTCNCAWLLITAAQLWNNLCSSPSQCELITSAPTLSCLKSRLKNFIRRAQLFGDVNSWTPINNSLELYLEEMKNNPYSNNHNN